MSSSGSRDRSLPPPIPDPIPGGVVDSHTHLDACGATDPGILAAILERAAVAGVTAMVTTADDLASAQWAAGVAGSQPGVLAAVGLHPTRSNDLDDATRTEIQRLATLPGVVAVGESGLDDYWTTRREDCAPLQVQREAFAWHIDLAKRAGLALVVHDRDAHDDVVDVLRAEGPPDEVVFHSFSGGPDLARVCAEHGWRMSFSGSATFRNANAVELRRAAAQAPDELLLTETDAPFLTPHPYRGRPNEPYCVPHTVRDLAELREQRVEALAAAATRNARRVFRLDEPSPP